MFLLILAADMFKSALKNKEVSHVIFWDFRAKDVLQSFAGIFSSKYNMDEMLSRNEFCQFLFCIKPNILKVELKEELLWEDRILPNEDETCEVENESFICESNTVNDEWAHPSDLMLNGKLKTRHEYGSVTHSISLEKILLMWKLILPTNIYKTAARKKIDAENGDKNGAKFSCFSQTY